MRNASDVASLFYVSLTPEEFQNDDWQLYCSILAELINQGDHDIDTIDYDSIREGLENIAEAYKGDEFYFEFDGAEYRYIHGSDIWGIYVEEIKNIVEDCYSNVLKFDKIPAFIAVSVDWEATAHNAYADGYGHAFAAYDGEEIHSSTGNFHLFRVN